VLRQHEDAPDDVERRGIIAKFIGGLRSIDSRWPQFGRTISTLPQVAIGTVSVRNVMPEPFGDVAAPAIGAATLVAMNAYLDGNWPFRRHGHTPPEPDTLPTENKHLDS